jgi:hypothetical protein
MNQYGTRTGGAVPIARDRALELAPCGADIRCMYEMRDDEDLRGAWMRAFTFSVVVILALAAGVVLLTFYVFAGGPS